MKNYASTSFVYVCMCRVEAICVLNQKRVFEDQLNTRVSRQLLTVDDNSSVITCLL